MRVIMPEVESGGSESMAEIWLAADFAVFWILMGVLSSVGLVRLTALHTSVFHCTEE